MTTLLRPFLLSSLALCFHANGQSSIAASYNWNYAICADHTLNFWGGSGMVLTPTATLPSLTNVRAVAPCTNIGLFLKNDSTVWTWTSQMPEPEQVAGLAQVTAIDGGMGYSVALTSNGVVYTWGQNNTGQLGDGSTTDHVVPTPVAGLPLITAISAGDLHVLALDATGHVWHWGYEDNMIPAPVQMAGIDNVMAMKATMQGEYDNSYVIRTDGTLWAWGMGNDGGQLGNGTAGGGSMVPTQVVGLSDMVAVTGSGWFGAALGADGRVWTWGWNWDNGASLLGNGTTEEFNPIPAPVPGLTDVVSISSGEHHTIAVRADGTAWAWGENYAGQLGNGTTDPSMGPIQVQGLCALAMQVPAVDDASAGALFPNPGNGDFTIPVDPRSGTVQISVIDATGRTVFAQHHMANNGQVAVHAANALPPGLYTVRIAAGAVVKLQKLIVQHN